MRPPSTPSSRLSAATAAVAAPGRVIVTPLTALRSEAESSGTPSAWVALARAYMRRHEHDAGLACFREAIRAAGADAETHCRFGAALYEAGRHDEAIETLERAHALDPSHEETVTRLGWLYTLQPATLSAARRLFRLAIDRSPEDGDHHTGFCRTFLDGGESLPRLRRLIAGELGPQAGSPVAPIGLMQALVRCGRYEEARRCGWHARAARPHDGDLLMSSAHIETALGHLDAARACYDWARTYHPRVADRSIDYLQFLFRIGEPRLARQVHRDRLARSHPATAAARDRVWRGEPVEGRTVLWESAGGYGDAILLSRFATRLAVLGADVVLECSRPLYPLLATLPGIGRLVLPHDDNVSYDLRTTPLMSAMLLDWEWPLRDVPYLRVDPQQRSDWRAALGDEPGFKVGLAWRTAFDMTSKDNAYTRRELPASALAPLLDLPGTVFYNLSAGRGSGAEIAARSPTSPVRDLAASFTSFVDTAAAIAAVDLVVTADTSVAHVAGALGQRCIVVLPYFCDWRWTNQGSHCGWYPATQVVRAPRPGDWTSVIATVREEVRRRAARPDGD